MKQLVLLAAVILLSTFTLIGQNGVCKIGSVVFKCPSKYYPEVQLHDPTIRLFKYKDGDDKVYFVMADHARNFDPAVVSKFIPGLGGPFEWKAESNPVLMDLGTKYKFDLVALLGLS